MGYTEYKNCQDYAEKVTNFYKLWHRGELPQNASDAELAVREYNKEWRSFKALYGYSIRGYINTIVNCIGFMVNC